MLWEIMGKQKSFTIFQRKFHSKSFLFYRASSTKPTQKKKLGNHFQQQKRDFDKGPPIKIETLGTCWKPCLTLPLSALICPGTQLVLMLPELSMTVKGLLSMSPKWLDMFAAHSAYDASWWWTKNVLKKIKIKKSSAKIL